VQYFDQGSDLGIAEGNGGRLLRRHYRNQKGPPR